ncbi:endonuclease/exonuclease/phosphatase family protein [Qiania dongpingensis]|uniref:Endonuclease n=1 Tax=Qiania dongpingensis TaxID=2763669 RepID=A0A7G9G1F8_9FIRM|nr:endonuclease/exonuclease/phosphatase family protein [Qiania dongpingensis]QNM04640.1 endonuclease [Qiania dongpingensis]
MKTWKIIAKVFGILLLLLAVAAGGYVAYMQFQYYRIEDNQEIDTENNRAEKLRTGVPYTIMTYNIGFGAYSQDYSFFMDTGEMLDGTKTTGKSSRAESREEAMTNTEGSIGLLKQGNTDFMFVQEVDEKATRSYQIDQVQMLRDAFPEYGSAFACNFHSAYLFYPLLEPHGAVKAGMLTFSKYQIAENTRKQFPVDNSFFTKFTDLDRCFMISRIPLEDGRELLLIQVHLSAYDKGGKIRTKQLETLNQVLKEEREKGNYVIVGGDFNHDIAGSIDTFPTEQKIPEWVYQLDDSQLAEGYHFVVADNAGEVPSCRGADIPYERGVTYTAIVDGFIVSDGVLAAAENLDAQFSFSDHNPVKMTFTLD